MANEPRFAICTFRTVFDTDPSQEFPTLPELIHVFRRFEVKPKVQVRVERETRRVDQAYEAWQAGKTLESATWIKLDKTAKEAEEAGRDPADAVREKAEILRFDAKRNAKRGIRLWSPALYKPGGRRQSEDVLHLSCLVLDYDDGSDLRESAEKWAPWFFLLHTTWSHTPEVPKYRIILPLAAPIVADDWTAVGTWAEARSGKHIDPTGKGRGSTFALPVIPSRDAPRQAFSHAGPLLDLRVEGVVSRVATDPITGYPALDKSVIAGFPDSRYVVHDQADPLDPDVFDGDAWMDDWRSESFVDRVEAPPVALPVPPPVPLVPPIPAPEPPEPEVPAAEPVPEPGGDLHAEVQALRALLVGWRRTNIVEGLERLHALHTAGGLTDEEYRLAKAKLLTS